MTAFLAMLRVSFRQVLGRRRALVLGLVALLPSLVTLGTISGYRARGALRQFHDAPIAVIFLIMLPVVALVLGSGALGDERREGTLSFLVLRPVRRETIVAAKLAAASLATFAIAGTGAGLAGLTLGAVSGEWGPLLPLLLAAALGSVAYCSVFLVVGFLTQRAVLLGLVYIFVWESGISFAAAGFAPVSLFRIGLSAYAGLVPFARIDLNDVLGSVLPGPWGAAAKVAVLAVLAVLAGGALIRRRDLVTEGA